MRICHIIDTLTFGGAQRLVIDLCNALCERHEIHLLYCTGEPQMASALSPAVRVHRIPAVWGIIPWPRPLLKRLNPDVVHTHLTRSDLFGLAAAYGLPCQRFSTLHNIWFKWDWRDRFYFAAYRVLYGRIAGNCRVICISQCVARHASERLAVPESRIRLVYNGIAPAEVAEPRSALRSKLGIPADSFCALFVGRFNIQKSLETLLRAARRAKIGIPELRVILVGEGAEFEKLVRLRAQLNLEDCVEFHPPTAHPEFHFAAADVFVLPSVYEGFGLVILEAFRASLPVIATRVEGPKEIIRDGENGILVSPQKPEEIAESLLRLRRDAELRKRLGEAGAATFASQFTLQRHVQSVEGLYQEDQRKSATSRS